MRRDQPDEAQQVVRAGLVFLRAAAKHDLFLRHKVRAAHIVPAINRRIESLLDFPAHIHEARAARAEQPLVRVRGQQIHVLHRRRKRAERLDGIEAEKNSALAQEFPDGGMVQPVAADEMTRRQRDQPRVFVHLPDHIPGPDDAEAAGVEQPHFDALVPPAPSTDKHSTDNRRDK